MSKFLKFHNLDNKKIFKDVYDCLKTTSTQFNLDPLDILLYLDKHASYQGIRRWFNSLASKYFEFTAIEYEPSSREEVEKSLEDFTILLTGARDKDVLMGIRTQSKNTVIKIFDGNVPPSRQALDNLRFYEDLWNMFLNKLSIIPYFEKFTRLEREIWLDTNQKIEDIYIQDIPSIKLHILDVGDATDGGFLQLSEDVLEKISDIKKDPIPIQEIVEEFPKKPGSVGIKGRHTLIFRRSIWKISILYKEVESYEGIIIDTVNGSIFKTAEKNSEDKDDPFILVLFGGIPKNYIIEKGKFIANEKQEICMMVYTNQMYFSDENFVLCINDSFEYMNLKNRVTLQYFTEIKNLMKKYNFTPAGYKSLLQKIIRFGPSKKIVEDSGELFTPITFLPCVIALLFMSPGSFVPDIQRFVSGTESAFKRVVISILEDSYFGDYSVDQMCCCACGAFLAQRMPGWRPTYYMVQCAMVVSIDAYISRKAFVWDIPRGMKQQRYTIFPSSKPLEIMSALLDEIKSFHGDLALARDITNSFYEKKLKFTTFETSFPVSMDLCHCIDQHWTPEIAYMYNISLLEKNINKGNSPFSNLFIRIFSEVTGINSFRPPRKGITMNVQSYDSNFEERDFVKETRISQRLILLSKNNLQPSIELAESIPNSFFKIKYNFGIEWIAGMLGAIEIKSTKKGPTAIVTMNPSNPKDFIAIRKPSRDMKDPFLSDERAEEAIHFTREILRKGVTIRSCVPMEKLKGSTMKIVEESDDVLFKIDGEWKEWSQISEGYVKIKCVKPIELTIENALKIKSSGVFENPEKYLVEVLENTNIKYVRKLLSYLTNKNIIEFKRLGRDGGGTKGIVTLDDVGAYQLFLKVYLIFSFAFSRKKNSCLDFYVLSKPCVFFIKNFVLDFLNKHQEKYDLSKYGTIKDSKNRKLWEHQLSAIVDLESNIEKGRKGSFLWLPVGSGKTMIVLEYLSRKLKNGTIPPYIIYTLPSSAIESIINEISFYGFEFVLLVPLKNLNKYKSDGGKIKSYIKNSCEPEKFKINLIEHDHLKNCEETLSDYMKDSIFVIDEVHKALNDTKRTATALQLSHLSREFIALTGTPIIDSNTYKLIWWLEQIINFEINKDNFWVAANAMIAKKFVTGVKIEHKPVYVKMNEAEEDKYKSLVPSKLGGKNDHATPNDFRIAVELCYRVVDKGIVKMVGEYIQKGHGVFVVSKDTKHQERLRDLFIEKLNIDSKDIFLITSTQTLFLTDESVAKGVHNYKIVITTIKKSAGYTLTKLDVMVTGVYPSNNADREQLEGRINRIGQKSPSVQYITVHTGILTYIMNNHNDARNLSAVLSALAGNIKM